MNSKFESVLILIIPQIVSKISEKYGISEVEASKRFYSSKVNELLEEEETGVWHFSALTLFNMYVEEAETGQFVIPEEA